MNSNRSERIEQLFSDALELTAEKRLDWLREQCAGDADLRSEVLELLAHLNIDDDRLERGAIVDVGPTGDTLFRPAVPGYRLLCRLAVGGQAIVYEAIQDSTEQKVAIKLLRAGTLSSEDEQRRFAHEVAVLAKIQHPHIVPIIDSGSTEQGIPFLVTQFVNGLPVDKYVDQQLRGPQDSHPDPTKLLPLFIKIANAVHVAHQQGIIHRDLKPSNILVDEYGEPRLLDFGVAKSLTRSSHDSADKAITVTGGFLGSLPWASPEQARGSDAIDQRTDVYSLGVVLYQMLTGGKFPYKIVGNMRDVLDNILNAAPTPLSKVFVKPLGHPATNAGPDAIRNWSPINPTLDAIVMRSLEKVPEHRQRSALELSNEIRDYLSGKSPTTSISTVANRAADRGFGRSRTLVAVGVVVVGVLVAFAAPRVWHRLKQSQTESTVTTTNAESTTSDRLLVDSIPVEWSLIRNEPPSVMLTTVKTLHERGAYTEAARHYRRWRGLRPTAEDEVECGTTVYHKLDQQANDPNVDRERLIGGLIAFISSHHNVLQNDVTALADQADNARTRYGELLIDPAPGSLEAIAGLYEAIRFHDRFIVMRPEVPKGAVNWNHCGRGQSWYCLARNLGHIGYVDAAAYAFEQAILQQQSKVHVSNAFEEQYHCEIAEASCMMLSLPDSAGSHARARKYAERAADYVNGHDPRDYEKETFQFPLALSLYRQRKYEEAETQLNQLQEEFLGVWLCRALICWRLERLDEAEKWLAESVEAAAADEAARLSIPVKMAEAALLHETRLTLGHISLPAGGPDLMRKLTQLTARQRYAEVSQSYREWRSTYWSADTLSMENESLVGLIAAKLKSLEASADLKNARILARSLIESNSQCLPMEGSSVERALLDSWLLLCEQPQDLGSTQHLVDLYTANVFLERLSETDNATSELAGIRGRILLSLGKIVAREGRFDEAMHTYDEAISLVKDLPRESSALAELRYHAAWLSATTGTKSRLPTTLTSLRAELAYSAVSHRGDYMTAVGARRFQQSQFEEAVETLRKAQELEHGNQMGNWLFLAQSLYKCGREDEAREWLEKTRQSQIADSKPSALIVCLYHETNKLVNGT